MLEQNNKVYTYIILIVNEREATQFTFITFVNVLSIEYFLYVNHLQNPETVKLLLHISNSTDFITFFVIISAQNQYKEKLTLFVMYNKYCPEKRFKKSIFQFPTYHDLEGKYNHCVFDK